MPGRLRLLGGLRRSAIVLLAIVGLLAIADGTLTLVWQEPVTAVIAQERAAGAVVQSKSVLTVSGLLLTMTAGTPAPRNACAARTLQ